jgi:AcrR family transcriptional regulator
VHTVAVQSGALSPRQLAKREQILDAAQRVILRDGPAACSTREIARASGLNKGLIYYYFDSIEEIVDAAMAMWADDLAEAVTIDGAGDAGERFWILVKNYVDVFETRPGLALAYYEYWMRCTRSGRIDKIEGVQDRIISGFTTVLAAAGVTDAPVRARVIVSYILGLLIRQLAKPERFEDVRPEIAYLAQIGF